MSRTIPIFMKLAGYLIVIIIQINTFIGWCFMPVVMRYTWFEVCDLNFSAMDALDV
jgi:hypothetical protein